MEMVDLRNCEIPEKKEMKYEIGREESEFFLLEEKSVDDNFNHLKIISQFCIVNKNQIDEQADTNDHNYDTITFCQFWSEKKS